MKPHLVLLHGWGFESSIWQLFTPFLEEKFIITSIDLPGFGKHPLPEETLTLDNITHSVLDSAPESAIYLGWSLGGLIAMNIAIHHPERTSHLITFSSTPKFVADENWPGMPVTMLERFYENLKTDYQATLKQFALLQFQGDSSQRALLKSIKELMSKSQNPSERALKEALDILKATDLRQDLKSVQCPQLYIYGRCDVITPAQVANEIISLNQNAKTKTLEKLSHAPFLSNPKLCAETVEAFLQ